MNTAASQVNPADEQMCLRLVRREKQRPVELVERLSIPFFLKQSPAALQIELRQLALVALPCRRTVLVDTGSARQLDVALQPFKILRHGIGAGLLSPPLVDRRQTPSQLFLAICFGCVAGSSQRGAKHEVRVTVDGVTAYS